VSEEDAETHPYKNILSRALGYLDASEPESGSMSSRCGDRLLLCSDGLSDTVHRDDIQAALEQSTPQCAVELLLDAAAANDARDNATALAVFLMPENAIEEPTQRVAFGAREVLSSPDVEATSRNPMRREVARSLQRTGPAERK
jgi:serine/threonine protein phosphatase PrpC